MLEEDLMEHKIVCPRCRQKFPLPSTYTERVICPHCRLENPILRKRSSSGNCMKEQLKKILRGSPKKPVASGSSLAKRPSFRALDQEPGVSAPKRAVLCGVTHKNWKYKLKGTINDVFNMKDLLTQVYKFEEKNILVLTEEQTDKRLIPTKVNIENCLRWLVKDCQGGDSLVFYYSGHGLRQPDFNNDERDGFDETICPVDFLKEGMILDNDIYATIVKPLPEGVTLHAIVDASHSGTILDLEHVYDRKTGKWNDNRSPSGARKQTSGGKAYSISACKDGQFAADIYGFDSNARCGAMTYILIEVLRRKPYITYGELVDGMEELFEQVLVQQQGCLGRSRTLSKIFGLNLRQDPLLSASEEFLVYKKPFKL